MVAKQLHFNQRLQAMLLLAFVPLPLPMYIHKGHLLLSQCPCLFLDWIKTSHLNKKYTHLIAHLTNTEGQCQRALITPPSRRSKEALLRFARQVAAATDSEGCCSF